MKLHLIRSRELPTTIEPSIRSYSYLTQRRKAFFKLLPVYYESPEPAGDFPLVRSQADEFADILAGVISCISKQKAGCRDLPNQLAEIIKSEQIARQEFLYDLTKMDVFRHPFVSSALMEGAIARDLSNEVTLNGIAVFAHNQHQDLLALHPNVHMRPLPEPSVDLSRIRHSLIPGFSLGLF